MSCQTMLQEQLDAVKEQLLSEENADLRQSVFSAYLEEPERGAKMVIAFAKEKGLKLDASTEDVVSYMNMDDDNIDFEMTPEMLASVSGGVHNRGYRLGITPGQLGSGGVAISYSNIDFGSGEH